MALPRCGGGQREASGDLPDWGEPAIQSAFPVSFCLALAHLAISLENLPVAEEAIIQALFLTAGLNRLYGGKDTYFCPKPLLKPNESKRENTCMFSQTQSSSAWSGSTGRFTQTALNILYIRLQMCVIVCALCIWLPGLCARIR
jgi:hypothetical protein